VQPRSVLRRLSGTEVVGDLVKRIIVSTTGTWRLQDARSSGVLGVRLLDGDDSHIYILDVALKNIPTQDYVREVIEIDLLNEAGEPMSLEVPVSLYVDFDVRAKEGSPSAKRDN